MSSIKDRGQTDRVITLPRPHALDIDSKFHELNDFQSQSDTHDTHTHIHKVKFKGQSFQKTEWKQTDGQTDATDYFTFTANVVSKMPYWHLTSARKRFLYY